MKKIILQARVQLYILFCSVKFPPSSSSSCLCHEQFYECVYVIMRMWYSSGIQLGKVAKLTQSAVYYTCETMELLLSL